MSTYRIKVFGKVQGVWFRKYVLQIASVLDYCGYVKNLEDGCVEVVVNIESESEMESFVSKLYEGSMLSKVSIMTSEVVDPIEFSDFTKRA